MLQPGIATPVVNATIATPVVNATIAAPVVNPTIATNPVFTAQPINMQNATTTGSWFGPRVAQAAASAAVLGAAYFVKAVSRGIRSI